MPAASAALYDQCDSVGAEPTEKDSAVPLHASKDRPFGDRRCFEPCVHCANSARLFVRAVRNGDLPTLAFLIVLRASYCDQQPFRRELKIEDVEQGLQTLKNLFQKMIVLSQPLLRPRGRMPGQLCSLNSLSSQ
jgi:hypothetical protein